MNFSFLPGMQEVKTRLMEAVHSNHIAHAQLFTGKPGALNLPLALAYANFLHCQSKGATDACGTCPACSKSLKYIHPDTSFVFPLGNIKGDKDEDRFKAEIMKTWRSFLLEQPFGDLGDWISFYGGEDKQALISREESREIIKTLSLKPFESPYKVMIIWQPELMHPSAANGILKILEEPPPNTFFILVTNAVEKLLPTIISRTQIVQVPLLADAEVGEYLTKKGVDEIRKTEIVSLADGNLNAAIKLIDSEQDQYQDRFSNWMRTCFKRDYGKMVSLTDEFYELDKLDQRNFLAYGLNMIRETALQFSGAAALNRVKGSEVKFVQDFSKVLNVAKAERISILISEAGYHLERNGSPKMIFLDLSLQLSKSFNS
jgi:DNA polymerase III subunit delta'